MSELGIGALGPVDTLDTPERVRLDLELAGPMSRAFAFSIDYVLILLLMTVGLMLVVSGSVQIIEWLSQFSFLQDLFERIERFVLDVEDGDGSAVLRGVALSIGIWLIFDLFLTTCYFLTFETLLRGRTPGKILTQLRVVSADGRVIGWRQSLLRNLLRMVDAMPAGYLVGIVAMLASPRTQRLGDLVANTVVIRERQDPGSDAALEETLAPEVEARFRFTRDEIAAIGEVERSLIRRTLRRAESLSARAGQPIVERTTQAITRRIARLEAVGVAEQRDFLLTLLRASERLL
ncbi:MAG: RDD family protein [Proteobacteria bacterium]|nr:RDD family protein [Pseudomonadota bacterium]